MYDTLLIGFAALLNLVLTFLGLYVAVRPVEQEKRKKRTLAVSFTICVLALIVGVYIAGRGTEAQTKLQGAVDQILGKVTSVQAPVSSLPPGNSAPPASVPKTGSSKPSLPTGFLQFAKIQYVSGDEFFTVGKPLQLNVYYINKGQAPVRDAYMTAALSLASRATNPPQRKMDSAVLESFEPQARARAQTEKGVTVGVDTLLWTTPSLPLPLTQQLVEGIMRGDMVLYVVSYARWVDSYGKSNDVTDCVWLNPPPSEHPELGQLVWEECSR